MCLIHGSTALHCTALHWKMEFLILPLRPTFNAKWQKKNSLCSWCYYGPNNFWTPSEFRYFTKHILGILSNYLSNIYLWMLLSTLHFFWRAPNGNLGKPAGDLRAPHEAARLHGGFLGSNSADTIKAPPKGSHGCGATVSVLCQHNNSQLLQLSQLYLYCVTIITANCRSCHSCICIVSA